MTSPPRYSLDEEHSIGGRNDNVESHPLLPSTRDGKTDQPVVAASPSTHLGPTLEPFTGPSDAQPLAGPSGTPSSRPAIYGPLTTLFSFHHTYMVPWDIQTEEEVGKLGSNRSETIQMVRRLFPLLERYPDERIELKVARSALGVGPKTFDQQGNASDAETSDPAVTFETLAWYPPASDEAKGILRRLMDIQDDHWAFLKQYPPGRVRVLVTPTPDEEKQAKNIEDRPGKIVLTLLGLFSFAACFIPFMIWITEKDK